MSFTGQHAIVCAVTHRWRARPDVSRFGECGTLNRTLRMSSSSPVDLVYRGSQKHKNRPTSERKGTLCPEWTHATDRGSYKSDPFDHDWPDTEAYRLLATSVQLSGRERRYATARGIAFEAKPTNDGTWHGYPIPWESVPPEILNQWIGSGTVTRRDIRKHWRKDKNDTGWAIGEDME